MDEGHFLPIVLGGGNSHRWLIDITRDNLPPCWCHGNPSVIGDLGPEQEEREVNCPWRETPASPALSESERKSQ